MERKKEGTNGHSEVFEPCRAYLCEKERGRGSGWKRERGFRNDLQAVLPSLRESSAELLAERGEEGKTYRKHFYGFVVSLLVD